MPGITNFKCIDEAGHNVFCGAFGNNLAIQCPSCGGPVLAISRDYAWGSRWDTPSICRRCHNQFWIEFEEDEEQLILHRIEGKAKTL